jgi:hypothetical protein
MKGDFTRDTFDPSKHFSRVLMQQGRVQLDADWNEQAAILLHHLRALAADLIGPFGGPLDNFGFGIFSAVVEKDPQAGELVFSKEESARLKAGVILEDGKLPAGDFLIGRGHYYVDGLLCESGDYVRYTGQSNPPATELLKGGLHLAYLDVWERHITYLEDESFPNIREVALGGPDTATRAKIVWQVKVLAVKEDDPDLKPKNKMWDNINTKWRDRVKRFEPENRGQLKARVKVPDVTDSNNPCLTPPDASYRGAENQLYRVEIHRGGGGKKGEATFKWSRENGSVVFPVVQIGKEMITLAHLGRDHRQGLKVGDWVELSNDKMVLSGTVPPLFQVDAIEPIDSTARVKIPKQGKPLPSTVTDEQPLILRRWDHKSDLKDDGAVPLVETGKDEREWLTLEDGVQIQFQPDGEYRTGDYWLIPARTATGKVEWPRDKDGNSRSQPPHGINHHYAPLAIVSVKAGGGIDNIEDLRSVIKPLAEKP